MGKSVPPQITIHLYGAENVGKYSLASQFTKGWIPEKSQPAQTHSKILKIDKLKYEVLVNVMNVKEAPVNPDTRHGILVIYSLSDRSSFNILADKSSPISQAIFAGDQSRRVPVVMAANKIDDATLSRQVDEIDGQKIAKDCGCLDFFEVGATCNVNVQKAFMRLVLEILENHPEMPAMAAKNRKSGCSIM